MSQWLPWLSLIVLAALSTWASVSLQQPLPGAQKRSVGADHAFVQPEARVFNLEGHVAYDIRGAQLEHRAESGEHILSQAEMRLYSQNHPKNHALPQQPAQENEHWLIQSERARLMPDREHVQLEGQVYAERRGVPVENRITLHAQDVTLAQKAQTAQSIQAVTVEGANWQSQSSAFHAHLSTEQLEQTGRVHDRYQPTQP